MTLLVLAVMGLWLMHDSHDDDGLPLIDVGVLMSSS
jgi:hypothetical protein